jgi:hypothetical protein
MLTVNFPLEILSLRLFALHTPQTEMFSLRRINSCEDRFDKCVDQQTLLANVTGAPSESQLNQFRSNCSNDPDVGPQLRIGEYVRSLERACTMTYMTEWRSAAVWRWLLFISLYTPLGVFSQLIARLIAALLSASVLSGNVRSQ